MSSPEKGKSESGFFFWWALALIFYFFVFALRASDPMHGNPWNAISVLSGIIFNLVFAVIALGNPGFVTRPFIKIFPDVIHSAITWTLLVFMNFFFIFYPLGVYQFSGYIRNEHSGLYETLSNVFESSYKLGR